MGGTLAKSQCLLGKQWVSKPQEKCRVPFILLGRIVQVCGRRHAICHWAQREMWKQIILEASKNWWYFCNGMNPMLLVSYVVPMTRGWWKNPFLLSDFRQLKHVETIPPWSIWLEQQMSSRWPLLIEVGTPYHRSYHDPSSSKCRYRMKTSWHQLLGGLEHLDYFPILWVWVNTYRYIFSGMNIHLPAILGFTRYQGFDPSPYIGNSNPNWPSYFSEG